MIDTIKLFIDAKTSLHPDLIGLIKEAAKNSLSEVLCADGAGNTVFVTIQTTADKIEQLGFKLAASGIEMAGNAVDVLQNAASQYSLYRDIHVNMNIEFLG